MNQTFQSRCRCVGGENCTEFSSDTCNTWSKNLSPTESHNRTIFTSLTRSHRWRDSIRCCLSIINNNNIIQWTKIDWYQNRMRSLFSMRVRTANESIIIRIVVRSHEHTLTHTYSTFTHPLPHVITQNPCSCVIQFTTWWVYSLSRIWHHVCVREWRCWIRLTLLLRRKHIDMVNRECVRVCQPCRSVSIARKENQKLFYYSCQWHRYVLFTQRMWAERCYTATILSFTPPKCRTERDENREKKRRQWMRELLSIRTEYIDREVAQTNQLKHMHVWLHRRFRCCHRCCVYA